LLKLFLVGALIGVLAFTPVFAKEDEEEAENEAGEAHGHEEEYEEDEFEEEVEESAVLEPHKDVVTNKLFVNYPDAKFPSGAKVHTLISIANRGKNEFNVTHIRGYLMAPDFSQYVENYTAVEVNRELNSMEEITVAYDFTPNENFEARSFGFTLLAYYEDQEIEYLAAIYNTSVDIVEPDDFTDPSTFYGYAIVVGSIAAVFVLGRRFSSPRRGKKTIETGTQGGGLTDRDREFIPPELLAAQGNTSGSESSKKKPSRRR